MPIESIPSFVGRDGELAAMHAALTDVGTGKTRLFLVTGEPGIGKSALINAFASQAGARGNRVLWGVSWEDGGAPAYWPWVQVLRTIVPELGDDAAGELAPLRTLLPDLAGSVGDRSGTDGDRFAVFDAAVRALELAARARPLVVIIEDLHAAGLPSALLLQFVAQHLRGVPVMLVATYRAVETRLAPGLGDIVAELEGAGTVLTLPGMSEPEVRDLLAPVLGDVSPEVLAAVLDRTEGNPLFVGQLAQLIAQTPDGSPPAGAAPIPLGIRQAVHQRMERLAAEELPRTVLTVCAVLGGEADLGEVAAVLDISAVDVLEALAPAIRAGLVIESGPQRCRFGHALVREAIYGDLSPQERATVHHRVAGVLAERQPHSGDHARLAHHFHAAVPVGGAEDAVHHATLAGREAMAALAYEEAVGLFRQAVSALHHTSGDRTEQRCELLLSVGSALLMAGDVGPAKPVLVQATEHARWCGNGELLGQAALLRANI